MAGPTASGKTELSILAAETLGIPIISADSRQSYKGLSIGTAKPSIQEQQRVQHYNISVLEPEKADSTGLFQQRINSWRNNELATCPLLFFAGGSTLYLESLIHPFDQIPPANSENLAQLEQEANEEGLEHLFHRLQAVDRAYSERMDGLNRHRIFRALDVWMQTGKPFSHFHSGNTPINDNTIVFVLQRDRHELYKRIEQRVDNMVEEGLMSELDNLLAQGIPHSAPGLNTVGYKELIGYKNGDFSFDEAIRLIKRNTRRYAKRQMTWFKRWEFAKTLDLSAMSIEQGVQTLTEAAKSLAPELDKRYL